ncbi:MAG: SRPBCC family protein [Chlamydiales bacterium]|nr:SRPBCC family protein [Chlamydiia bacterium]MCP5508714.1 SRPBCC family protein [Chlamydiales bacterium]
MRTFIYRSEMPISAEKLFNWHRNPDAFQQLMPPGKKVDLIQPPKTLQPGELVIFRIQGIFPITWIAEHVDYIEGRLFSDRQKKGPFKYWHHRHEMIAISADQSELIDTIEWELPGGTFINWLAAPFVNYQLQRLFAYRHQTTLVHLISETKE